MATIVEALGLALGHQRARRCAEAEAIYREILRIDPRNADALHLLGMLAYETGKPEPALALVCRAIAVAPRIAPFHNSAGMILHGMRRLEEARRAFETALEIDPGLAQARVNLGNLLQDLGSPREALAHYEEALRVLPDAPEIHNNLGNAHLASGNVGRAESSFREALRRNPDYAEALVNLGGVLHEQGCLEEAESCCRNALRLQPTLAEAQSNLAAVLVRQNRLDEAESCCREALRLRPAFAPAWCNLGDIANRRRRFAEAEACCREAVRHSPQHAESWNNLGNALKQQDRLEEAVACYQEALRLRPGYADAYANLGAADYCRGNFAAAMESCEAALRAHPDHAEAHWNRALLLLLQGRFAEGWQEYEWRPRRSLGRPQWDGTPLAGRTILVHAEQGLGDSIQFVRYLPLVKAAGGRVLFECQPRLLPLLRGMPGCGELIGCGSPLPDFDVQIPLLSLPRLFGLIPAAAPYLAAGRSCRDAAGGTLRVGVAWAGNPENPRDRVRSVPVELLRCLADVPGVTMFSLQQSGTGAPAWLRRLDEAEAGITGLAAAILSLDLVLSVDTMAAHLAGALGVPVWILLPFVPDWRWLLDREDSPWYSSARLFRQARRGDWGGAVARLKDALIGMIQAQAGPDDKSGDGKCKMLSPARCRDLIESRT